MELEVKQPTTYEQQVDKLRSRGCIIDDPALCIQKLKEINYYRFTAYFISFWQENDHDKYIPGTSFTTVYNIYEFDKKLRGILFSAIEDTEIYLRSTIAYYHAHKYGALGYLDPQNFKSQKHNADRFNNIINDAIKHNQNVPFVKHHINKYGGKLPIWGMVEILTFSNISFFFSDMKMGDQKAIARNCFSAHQNAVSSWLLCCSNLRNLCAHYGRLYNRTFTAVPSSLNLSPEEERQLWGVIMALRALYPDSEKWNNSVCISLTTLIAHYQEYIDLSCIGFPDDWQKKIQKLP